MGRFVSEFASRMEAAGFIGMVVRHTLTGLRGKLVMDGRDYNEGLDIQIKPMPYTLFKSLYPLSGCTIQGKEVVGIGVCDEGDFELSDTDKMMSMINFQDDDG